MLAHAVGVVDFQADGHLDELGDVEVFEFGEVHGVRRREEGEGWNQTGEFAPAARVAAKLAAAAEWLTEKTTKRNGEFELLRAGGGFSQSTCG
jgi:hypothetical protein